MLLMAAFMLLCCSHALAESMQAVSAGRIQNVTLPEGIVTIGNPVITNGKISIRVDDDNTNWTEVLMKAASRDGLGVSLTIAAPDGAVAGVRENFASDDGETLDAIARGMAPEWFDYAPEPLAGNSVDGSAMFAEIRFGQTTYVEPVAASGAGTVICWENAGGQRQYEYVQWEIIHSNAGLREAPMPALTKKMLSSVSAALPAGVTAEIEMGGVTCTVEDFSAITNLPIVINAPAGATEAVVYSINGEESVPVNGGKVQLTITANSHPTFRNQIAPAQLDYTVAFVSGDGPDAKLHDFGLVTVWLLSKEKAPYPYYNQQGAKPVANDRLTIWQGNHQVNNKIVYQERYGNAHLTKAGLNFSANNSGNIRMEVTAPAWAVAYAVSESGGDFIYQTNWGLNISDEKQRIAGGESITVYNRPLFKTVRAGRALVYLQEGITARYGGYVRVISWYDSENAQTPRLIEYLSITHDEFSEKVRNAVKKNEQDIDEPVAEVTGVSQNNWQLIVQHDPQSGERAIHYDLHMEDERGVSYKLDGDTAFYVPYPDGLSYADKDVTYQMYHYSEDYQSYVVVQLEPTPYGLRFVEDNLSPFVLMWDEKAAAPTPVPTQQPETNLPKTGDNTHIEWLIALLLLSTLGLVCMLRSKRRA